MGWGGRSGSGGTGAGSFTPDRFVVSDSVGALSVLAAANDGEFPIGVTGGTPVIGSIQGTANRITVTPSPGSILLDLPQNIHTGATPTFAGATFTGDVAITGATSDLTIAGGLTVNNGGGSTNAFVGATYVNDVISAAINAAKFGVGGLSMFGGVDGAVVDHTVRIVPVAWTNVANSGLKDARPAFSIVAASWSLSGTGLTIKLAEIEALTLNGGSQSATDAYALFLNAPVAGSATITNPWALGTSGAAKIGGNLTVTTGGLTVTGTSAITGVTTVSTAATSGGATTLTVTSGAHTAITAEKPAMLVSGATITHSSDPTLFTWARFNAPTLSGTIPTLAATVYIEGAPVNATAGADYALYVAGGRTFLGFTRIQPAAVSGGISGLIFQPANHTGVTSEKQAFDLKPATYTITGNITKHAWMVIGPPTFTAASAQTITTAATVRITGAPIAAGSAVLTNTYAIHVESGDVVLAGGLNVGGASGATTGQVRATGSFVTNATGTGLAGYVSYTGSENTGTGRSTGIGTIKFADGTSRDCVGFVKIMAGTTAYYAPLFAAN